MLRIYSLFEYSIVNYCEVNKKIDNKTNKKVDREINKKMRVEILRKVKIAIFLSSI